MPGGFFFKTCVVLWKVQSQSTNQLFNFYWKISYPCVSSKKKCQYWNSWTIFCLKFKNGFFFFMTDVVFQSLVLFYESFIATHLSTNLFLWKNILPLCCIRKCQYSKFLNNAIWNPKRGFFSFMWCVVFKSVVLFYERFRANQKSLLRRVKAPWLRKVCLEIPRMHFLRLLCGMSLIEKTILFLLTSATLAFQVNILGLLIVSYG